MTVRIAAPHPRAAGAPSALRGAPSPRAALGLPGSAAPGPGKQTRTAELEPAFPDPLDVAADPPTGHVVADAGRGEAVLGAEATSAARKRYATQLEQMFGRPERGR